MDRPNLYPTHPISAAGLTAAFLLAAAVGTLPAQEPDAEEAGASEVDYAELDDAVEPNSPDVAAADAAARSWLRHVDEGRWEDVWTSGASTLQVTISPQKLKSAISDGRRGLDSLAARTLIGFQPVTNPPNAAPGDYVILQYRLRGTPAWSAVETVAPMKEDGEWRVTGYAIKRERP